MSPQKPQSGPSGTNNEDPDTLSPELVRRLQGTRHTRSTPGKLGYDHDTFQTWEELTIRDGSSQLYDLVSTPNHRGKQSRGLAQPADMSARQRGRGGGARDGTAATSTELDLMEEVTQHFKRVHELELEQKDLSEQIVAMEAEIAKKGSKPTSAELAALDQLYRRTTKSADTLQDLTSADSDLQKHLQTLIAISNARTADESLSTSSGRNPPPKSRQQKRVAETEARESPAPSPSVEIPVTKLNRVKHGGSVVRSTSTNSVNQHREAATPTLIKTEDGAAATAASASTVGLTGTSAESSGQFVIGAEVVYKHNKKQHGVEGEGIQCIIKTIVGEGPKKRYEVQDPEPGEEGPGAIYRTSAASLIPIPKEGALLPTYAVGKQVLARYPDTTTFYRAEVMAVSKKDGYRLKFEGEEDDKEMDVDRRFVLDLPAK